MYAAYQRNQVESWNRIPYGDRIRVPETTVLTSDFFDRFLASNGMTGLYAELDYGSLVRRFLEAPFPKEDHDLFRDLIQRMNYPLAIRSSSLLEDNLNYSFAGIYLTLFIPNHGDLDARLRQFEIAVKRVYASTYNPNAHAYRDHHGLRGRQEKMSILVQRLVGKFYGELFYPPIAGVAYSQNYFPWSSKIQTSDGLVRIVFGLGTRAVGRNYARVFSPSHPMLRPEGSVTDQIVRYSQEQYDALEIKTGELVSPNVSRAVDENPDLTRVCSILRDYDTLVDPSPLGLEPDDRPIITFNAILKESRYIPLVPMIRGVLDGLEQRFGLAVDVEFACTFEDSEGGREGHFYLLQCRPLGVRPHHAPVKVPDLGNKTVIFAGSQSMGNGERNTVRHLIYVSPRTWRRAPAAQLARRIGYISNTLGSAPYILAGPGRWGTNNPELGIPVTYGEIHNAAVLVEIAADNTTPELSYGTHFFGDLLADDSYYMPIFPEKGDRLNEEWLDAQPNQTNDPYVKLIVLEEPFTATFDGRRREAAVYL